MSALDAKVDDAIALIKATSARHQNPVVYSSFGKDSMVMLSLIGKAGLKFPIIFHREAHEPKKYAFGNRVIEQNNYEVYDWPPRWVQVIKEGDIVDIVNRHQVGAERFDYMPIQIRPPQNGEDFLCGLRDLYLKPTGSFIFPWDVAFIGNKNADVDRLLGHVPLNTDFQDNAPECSLAFPLRHFTHDDVWEYTLRERLPINRARYDEKNGWKEQTEDISQNPDWFAVCTLCMNPDSPAEVVCPKSNLTIPNVADKLNWIENPRGEFKFVDQEAAAVAG